VGAQARREDRDANSRTQCNASVAGGEPQTRSVGVGRAGERAAFRSQPPLPLLRHGSSKMAREGTSWVPCTTTRLPVLPFS
jgi:hypothetical protein